MHQKKKKKKKKLYPNVADFQLKKKEKREKRRKNETHGRPLVLQHSRPMSSLVSSLVFSLIFYMDPATFRVIK
jgi:hypothetical protein